MLNTIDIKGILLDLDDTLVDSRTSWKNGFKETFNSFTVNESEQFDLEKIYIEYTKIVAEKHLTSNSREWSDEIAKAGLKKIIKKYLNQDINIISAWNCFESSWKKNIELFPETYEILNILKLDFKIGMITNGLSEHQRYKLKKFKLEKYFNCILISEEFGKQKPDIEIFSEATRRMKIPNHQLIHVGDNPNHDVVGANTAGIYSCWLKRRENWYQEIEDVKPNFIISNLLELTNIIKER